MELRAGPSSSVASSFYDVAPALRASNLESADPRARLDSLGLRCVSDLAP